MKVWEIHPGVTGYEALKMGNRREPKPGLGQVVVRVHAASLNYRDQSIVCGRYALKVQRPTVPLSDGAGEVVAVGDGVLTLKVGDHVAGTFTQPDPTGLGTAPPSAMGVPLDGMLAEYVLMHEAGAIRLPEGYSFEEGACLPCAGVTAWNCLFHTGGSMQPGDTVLVLGTGGVSIWALQLAKAAGCRVVVTSSSDEKLERAQKLGADIGINYKTTPEWGKEVMRLTEGHGADCIVEVGGLGTLEQSFATVAQGGKVGMIGVLSPQGSPNPRTLQMRRGSFQGVFVGDRSLFEQLIRAVEVNNIKPVIDKVFSFEDAIAAYQHQSTGHFMGKLVISV